MYYDEGKGIFDIRLDYNNKSKKTLEHFGNQYIRAMRISRAPIPSAITKALSFVTWGKSKEHYDDFFHLALIVTLDSKDCIVEKNEVINISTEFEMSKERDLKDVALNGKRITLNELLNKTLEKMGTQKYFSYNWQNNNCQVYIDEILKSNGLLTPELHKFLFQDLKEISKSTPWLADKVANLATHTAALWDKLTGKGKVNIEKELANDLVEFCKKNNVGIDEGYDAWYNELDPRIKKIFS